MRSDKRWYRLLAAATDNWVSRGYLLVFTAVLVWVVAGILPVTTTDASFAGVWLFFLTVPTSVCVLALPDLGGWELLVGCAVAAFVNAMLLGLLVRSLTSSSRGGPRSHLDTEA